MQSAHHRRVAVVADDITGANDIGLMFAKNGLNTAVIPFDTHTSAADFTGLDVAVLNTDSRFDTPAAAAGKVRRATELLQSSAFDLYFNKTCSVFRGNIGAELDAMQSALGERCSMVVLGFPKLGRTTAGGVHYLNGTRLDQSPFVDDPIHPATEADLRRILARQSSRTSAVFTAEMLDLPETARRAALAGLRESAAYVIFDVRDQQDLRAIAALIADARNICGSSAIGEELPKAWGVSAAAEQPLPPEFARDGRGTLILAGSLTEATQRQIAFLKRQGVPWTRLNPDALLDGGEDREAARVVEAAAAAVSEGRDYLVHTANDPQAVAASKSRAKQRGLDAAALGRLISRAVGKVAFHALSQTGARRAVAAGGDTSMAVSEALGIRRMAILHEIEPGVPAMLGTGRDGRYALVFKSGSFGSDAFLRKAADAVNV